MKRRIAVAATVTFCSYMVDSALAGPCNDFRNDIQTIQQQVRQDQFARSTSGLSAVALASNTVKGACLDSLSALDMTAFGLTPGAAAMITKLSSAACQQLATQVSQSVGQVTQQVSQGVTGDLGQLGQAVNGQLGNGIGGQIAGQAMGQVTSQVANQVPVASQSITSQISSAIGSAWDSMKSFIGP